MITGTSANTFFSLCFVQNSSFCLEPKNDLKSQLFPSECFSEKLENQLVAIIGLCSELFHSPMPTNKLLVFLVVNFASIDVYLKVENKSLKLTTWGHCAYPMTIWFECLNKNYNFHHCKWLLSPLGPFWITLLLCLNSMSPSKYVAPHAKKIRDLEEHILK